MTTKATTMTLSLSQIEAYVDAAAAAIGLTLDARHRSGMIAYLGLAATMAAQLDAMPLGVADEPAGPAFVPIGPGDVIADTPPEGVAADAFPGDRP